MDIVNVGANRYEVTIRQVNQGSSLVVINGDNVNDVIQRITILDNTDIPATAELVQLRISQSGGETQIDAIEEIDVLNPNGSRLRIMEIKITGDLGASGAANFIEARNAETFTIGGDWYASVRLDDVVSGGTFDVSSVDVDGAWISGGIYNNNGRIETIRVLGDVGVASQVELWAKTSIDTIEIFNDAPNLRIGSNSIGGFSGNSDIGNVLIEGDFNSSTPMAMNSLASLRVSGDYNADIELLTPMGTDDIFDIGGSLGANAGFRFPQNGLAGQIIVNSDNLGGIWTTGAAVHVATAGADIVIDDPVYPESATDFGGGAAGLVPYNLHAADCVPVPGISRLRVSGRLRWHTTAR